MFDNVHPEAPPGVTEALVQIGSWLLAFGVLALAASLGHIIYRAIRDHELPTPLPTAPLVGGGIGLILAFIGAVMIVLS